MSETLIDQQCLPGELWRPGLHLDTEYPTPSDAALEDLWQCYNPAPAIALKGVYGVYSKPDKVNAVASVDLCEVVRDTIVGIDLATGLNGGRRGIYAANTWFDPETMGTNYERSVVTSVARTIMGSGQVKPVENIAAIGAILRNWRKAGVYCIANTSTLPGCEEGTITHTLGRDLAGCFDALVLPRNHDGRGSITKAMALSIVAAEADLDLANLPSLHIDDAGHHMAGFRAHFADSTNKPELFVPVHVGNEGVGDVDCATPFDAFVMANRFLKNRGITV